MKPKQYRRFSLQKEKTTCIKRVSPLSPDYLGNIAHLIRLYLRICRNPYLHLPRVRANCTPWHFIELDGHFYLDLGLDLPTGRSEWDFTLQTSQLPACLQQGDAEAEEHFCDILKAMLMMFYLPVFALKQPQSCVCNKTVLLPETAKPPQNDEQRTNLIQNLFFNSHIMDARRRLIQDGGILYFILDEANPTKRRPLRELIDEINIRPQTSEPERQNMQTVMAFYREMSDFLQSGLPKQINETI
ncbi:MAG: hypothetical protein D8H97_20415 [Neisseria sp.]|nr:MAG: hypothetical protein D8H97_20415 [Neisseria sp.]